MCMAPNMPASDLQRNRKFGAHGLAGSSASLHCSADQISKEPQQSAVCRDKRTDSRSLPTHHHNTQQKQPCISIAVSREY